MMYLINMINFGIWINFRRFFKRIFHCTSIPHKDDHLAHTKKRILILHWKYKSYNFENTQFFQER